MKIVFEFYGDQPQSTGSVTPYIPPVASDPDEWPGSRCEILVQDAPADPVTNPDPDCLYLEGDTKAVRAALRAALNVLDAAEALHRADHEKRIADRQGA